MCIISYRRVFTLREDVGLDGGRKFILNLESKRWVDENYIYYNVCVELHITGCASLGVHLLPQRGLLSKDSTLDEVLKCSLFQFPVGTKVHLLRDVRKV